MIRLSPRLFAPCLFVLLTAAAVAAPPEIRQLSLRGLQSGGTTTVVISGQRLLPDPQLILPVPIAGQKLREGATANRAEFEVTLAADVRPGIYPLRLANAEGISNHELIAIDALPQLPVADKVESLPVALTGRVGGPVIIRTSFAGKQGQRFVADVEARRLGGNIDPVLRLLNADGVQLTWAQGHSTMAEDARIAVTLPADGQYTVELHEASYKGGQDNHFRLKLGDLKAADLVFPLGVQKGTDAQLSAVGAAAGETVPFHAAQVGLHPAVLPAGFTGSAPRVYVTDLPEFVEQADAKPPQPAGEAPLAINGRLAKPGEEDRFLVKVAPGSKLRFEVFAQRAGSPLDGFLAVRKPDGGQLAANDDQKDDPDPAVDVTVPKGVDQVVVALRDLVGAGGENYLYRIEITPLGQPDFDVELLSDRVQVPQGGAAVLRVRAKRSGYAGPIDLEVSGLPAGVQVSGTQIPAKATDALLSLSAPEGTKIDHAMLQVTATAKIGNREVARAATTAATVPALQPWLARDLATAVSNPDPIQITWTDSNTRLPLGFKQPVAVRIKRVGKAAGPVRLALLTSQIVPKKKENNKEVEDVAQAIRFEGKPQLKPNEETLEANVIVPAKLPRFGYWLAIQAELLSDDGKRVVATAVTPSRLMEPSAPFELQLAGAQAIEAKAGSGATGKFTGKVLRAAGFDGDIVVTLAGLPRELPAPETVLAKGEQDFQLPVAFPFGTSEGALKNVSLVASSRVGTETLTAPAIPVEIKVVKGDPPPPPPPLTKVFEDERYFVNLLIDGKGKASLEELDRYSGRASLRVTPDQVSRQKLPNWGYKIKENPGEGEFRYLRFAWKKEGGKTILLQLAANGNWGPNRGAQGPSYRYEAGADNAMNVAALKVDQALPKGWTVVTRDLFKDFGEFTLDGLAFTAADGKSALFDHLYLARTEKDLEGCPQPAPPDQPLAIFEDDAEFLKKLTEGGGQVSLDAGQKFSGAASVKVTPDQKFNPNLPGLGVKIRENPGPGEYRYLTFAWRKSGGQSICLQINHDGQWGPADGKPAKFRYHAGPGAECYGASLELDKKLPGEFTVVVRDLFKDFGEFTFTGIALSPVDGEAGWFDHIYLGKTPADFELVAPK